MSVNFVIRGSQVSSRPPICAICTPGDEPRMVLVQRGEGVRHWPNEGHVTKPPEKRDETPPVTKVRDENAPIVTKKGRPKRYTSRAAQQAAYRERRR